MSDSSALRLFSEGHLSTFFESRISLISDLINESDFGSCLADLSQNLVACLEIVPIELCPEDLKFEHSRRNRGEPKVDEFQLYCGRIPFVGIETLLHFHTDEPPRILAAEVSDHTLKFRVFACSPEVARIAIESDIKCAQEVIDKQRVQIDAFNLSLPNTVRSYLED